MRGCLGIVRLSLSLLFVDGNLTWNLGQQADDRKSLARVPETFNRLVKDRGPLAAVRATVGLLMPAS
jgi:hypothetical protein